MTLYAGYRGGLYVVDPDAESARSRLVDRDVECLATHAERPDRVLAGTFGDGLHRSTDSGDSFESIGSAIEQDAVTAAAVSPHDPDEIWVGTEPSRVYRSVDGGDSFERIDGLTDVESVEEWSFPPRPDTHHVRWIEPCPAEPDRWYVGIEAGALLVTPDAGDTWIDRPDGSRRDNHTLATHPDAPDRVYSAAGDGFAVSDDRGETWSHPQNGLDHRYVWGLAVDPDDPDTVFVSSASGAGAAHRRGEAYLYRTRDFGESWTRIGGDGVPTGDGTYRAVLASGTAEGDGNGCVWALHNHGLYRTRDAGDSWSRASIDVPPEEPARALVTA